MKAPLVRASLATLAVAAGAVVGMALVAGSAAAATATTDSAYGISAEGGSSIAKAPAVSSSDGSTKVNSGSAKSSDSSTKIDSASVSAGAGKASAKVTGFTFTLGGGAAPKAQAATVEVACNNGAVTGSVSGATPEGKLGAKGNVAYNVKTVNSDGSVTIVGMQVTLKVGPDETVTINVASATCAVYNGPTPTGSSPTGSSSSTAHAGTSSSSTQAAGLAVTGTNTTRMAGIGAALVVIGVAAFVFGRRRRARFTTNG